jgi:hypothetical protein
MCDYIKHIVDTILTKTDKQPKFFTQKDEAALFDSISIPQADYANIMSNQKTNNQETSTSAENVDYL